jgi:Rhodopirellula transposase DDE domain
LVLEYVVLHTAGSPTDIHVKWTDLKPRDIKKYLTDVHIINVSHGCIKRILKAAGYVKRKPIKSLSIGESIHRAAIFEIVIFTIGLFQDMLNSPILSIDTKKKEKLGQLTRNEAVLTKKGEIPTVYSSDYAHLSTGRAIPHGIFDVKLCKGYISIGNSHETAEFVIDNLRWWWFNYGKNQYKNAKYILILCDCGGANGNRHHLFKVLLQQLAKEIGVIISVSHYPPYCSKYNPIERKLFSHVHRTITGSILTSLEQTKSLMEKTAHDKGLTVVVRINDKGYPLKQPSNKEDIIENRIVRHENLPQFAYALLP